MALTPDGAIDLGGDWYPQLTTDSAGNWIAVWYTYLQAGTDSGDGYLLLSLHGHWSNLDRSCTAEHQRRYGFAE